MTTPSARDVLIASLKGEFSDFEIIDIDLSVLKGDAPHSVPSVWICDVWAIHMAVETIGYWTLTHMPTGLAIHRDSTLAAVLMALGVVIASGLPWDMVATKEDAERMSKGLSADMRRFNKTLQSIFALDIPAETEKEVYA